VVRLHRLAVRRPALFRRFAGQLVFDFKGREFMQYLTTTTTTTEQ
jgi:hypothetical protein